MHRLTSDYLQCTQPIALSQSPALITIYHSQTDVSSVDLIPEQFVFFFQFRGKDTKQLSVKNQPCATPLKIQSINDESVYNCICGPISEVAKRTELQSG